MMPFYYCGIKLYYDKKDLPYNRIIVKINDLVDLLKNEQNIKKIERQGLSCTFLQNIPFDRKYDVCVEYNYPGTKEKRFVFGLYNKILGKFEDIPCEKMDRIFNEVYINRLCHRVNALAGATLNNEKCRIDSDIERLWEERKSDIYIKEYFGSVLNVNLTDGIKTASDLRRAVERAESHNRQTFDR